MSTPPSLPPVESVDDVIERFLAGTLDRDAWTHPAHLMVCRHLVDTTPDIDAAIARMQTLIQAHNARVGVAQGHGGYHETITRYYVQAVAATAPATTADLLAAPALQREAPLRHWSREVLGSSEARSTWVPPDRDPLPWSLTP